MPTPTKGPRLGGSPAHERLMLANLATSLFEHDRITTTEAKAKRLRPLAERLITFAKRGDLHARRQVMTVIRDKDVVHKLFAEIGPQFADRAGWLHADHQDRPAQGRQRPDGGHRAGRGAHEAQVVAEAEQARGTRSRRARPPTGRTKEIAEDAAAESPTAAAVAADCGRRRRGPTRRRRRGRCRGGVDEVVWPPRHAVEGDEPTAEAAADGRRRARGRRRAGRGPSGDEPSTSATEKSSSTEHGTSSMLSRRARCVRVRLDLSYDGTGLLRLGRAARPAHRAGRARRTRWRPSCACPRSALTVAGRTDAGVHATGQVAHFDLPAAAGPSATLLVRRLAGVLPADVRVRAVRSVPAGFDARFAALWRRYVYRITDADAGPDPLRRRFVLAGRAARRRRDGQAAAGRARAARLRGVLPAARGRRRRSATCRPRRRRATATRSS